MKRSALNRDAWRGLDLVSPPSRSEVRVAPTEVLIGGRSVLYAIDSEGLYHLLVPVSRELHLTPDQRSAGVHLVPRELAGEDNGEARFLDVACKKHHLQEVFKHLADEMVHELHRDPSSPVATCRAVLGRWRELLGREATQVLSEQALLGLFGELWHLREMARIDPGALGAWAGPSGARHDFLRGSTALEVKTSQKQDDQRFEIHGIDQLAPPPDGTLYFAATFAEPCEEAGESVPDVIAALQQCGVDMLELMTKLAELGYRTIDEHYYAGRHYKLLAARLYLVDESFPRIVRNSFAGGALPSRIVRLTYLIDLVGLERYALPDEAVAKLYTSLSGA